MVGRRQEIKDTIVEIGIQDVHDNFTHAEVLKMYTEVFGISHTPSSKFAMIHRMYEYFTNGGT